MYFRIPNDIIDKYGDKLGAYGLAVYMCLARFTNQEMVSWPSYETIAKRTGITRRTVIKEVAKLQELGLIEVTPQYNPETKENRSNLFTLLKPRGSEPYSPPPSERASPPSEAYSPRKRLKKDISTNKKKSYIPDYEAEIIPEAERQKYTASFA